MKKVLILSLGILVLSLAFFSYNHAQAVTERNIEQSLMGEQLPEEPPVGEELPEEPPVEEPPAGEELPEEPPVDGAPPVEPPSN
ncbi:hypothetical protein [Natroniella sp. ANB-PHB2]|uniref:hypothetical protein n=1 Tax=Natroniella sp. ANB-PHB2 TaxID=3384444 RepID=UPI0038D3F958